MLNLALIHGYELFDWAEVKCPPLKDTVVGFVLVWLLARIRSRTDEILDSGRVDLQMRLDWRSSLVSLSVGRLYRVGLIWVILVFCLCVYVSSLFVV